MPSVAPVLLTQIMVLYEHKLQNSQNKLMQNIGIHNVCDFFEVANFLFPVKNFTTMLVLVLTLSHINNIACKACLSI